MIMTEDSKKIVIHADLEIASLIPGYIENRKKDAVKIKEALNKGDYEMIGFLGHSMRGSGAAYGFEAVSAIGQILEQAAGEKNEQEIGRQLDELINYLQRIEVVYE